MMLDNKLGGEMKTVLILVLLAGPIPLWDSEHGGVRRITINSETEVDVRSGDRVCYEDGYCMDVVSE